MTPIRRKWLEEKARQKNSISIEILDYIKSLETDLGLAKIELKHKATLLESCEKALEKRDEKYLES